MAINVDIQSLIIQTCKDDFWTFIEEFWDEVPASQPMVENWHMRLLADELQVIAERIFENKPKLYDLVINISPGTSKSSICSILYPAWIWARKPSARVISASHTQSLVLDLSSKAKAVITSDKYREFFPYIELAKVSEAYYTNTLGGDRFTCTVGGKTPMGMHSDIHIIDDPLDPQKALSEAELSTASNFVTNVMPTRATNKEVTTMVLIAQRLHQEDPTGVLLDIEKREGATKIRHICLPAELGEGDYVSPSELREKYIDGLMDPKRLSKSVLKSYLIRMGNYAYLGQFSQRPISPGGQMFKEEYFSHRVKASPFQNKRIRYWDRACLIGEMSVISREGIKRIDSVVAGDEVLTRKGFRKVKWAGETKQVTETITLKFSNGLSLTGTKEHKIWTENRKWIPMEDLTSKDEVLSYWDIGEDAISETSEYLLSSVVDKYEQPIPVYDIEVEGEHEFFANGILVHNSTEGAGCATAGVLMSRDDLGNFFVEHVVVGQWEPYERNNKMRATAQRDRARYGPKYEPKIYVEREGGSSGRDAWKGVARALAGFPVFEHAPRGDKVTRAEPWSAQCAAGNVYIVDNGQSKGLGVADWDVNGYQKEHILFPLTKMKDMVDASSGAFSIFLNTRPAGTVSVKRLNPNKSKGLKIFVCTKDELINTTISNRALLISVQDLGESYKPEHGIEKLLDYLVLQFLDVEPEKYQDSWNELLPPYNKPIADLMMTREHGKKLWGFVTRKREFNPEVIVIQDEGDSRALSLAQGICDILGLKREEGIYQHNSDNSDFSYIKNKHIFETVKATRGMVI